MVAAMRWTLARATEEARAALEALTTALEGADREP